MNFGESNDHCKEIETLTFRMLFLGQGEFPGVKLSRAPYNLVAKRLRRQQVMQWFDSSLGHSDFPEIPTDLLYRKNI